MQALQDGCLWVGILSGICVPHLAMWAWDMCDPSRSSITVTLTEESFLTTEWLQVARASGHPQAHATLQRMCIHTQGSTVRLLSVGKKMSHVDKALPFKLKWLHFQPAYLNTLKHAPRHLRQAERLCMLVACVPCACSIMD